MRNVLSTILLLLCIGCEDIDIKDQLTKRLYDQSLNCYKQEDFSNALKISGQIQSNSNNPKLLGDSRYLRGYIYMKLDSAELAFYEFIGASQFYKRARNWKGVSKVSTELGQIFYENDSYIISKRYFKHALDFAEESGDDKLISNALYGLGKVEKRLNNLGNAFKYMNKALEFESRLKRLEYFVNVKLEMADLFHLGTNYKLAMEKNWEVINLTQGTELEQTIKARAHCNIADLYLDQGDYLRAKQYLDKSDSSSFLTSGDQAILNNNYGRYYHAVGNDILAAQYFKKSLDLNHIYTDMIEVAETKMNIELLASGNANKDSLYILYRAISNVSLPDLLIREKLERAEEKIYLEDLLYEQQKNNERERLFQNSMLIAIMAIVLVILSYKLRSKIISSKHSDSYAYYVQMSEQLAKNRKQTRAWMKRAKKDLDSL